MKLQNALAPVLLLTAVSCASDMQVQTCLPEPQKTPAAQVAALPGQLSGTWVLDIACLGDCGKQKPEEKITLQFLENGTRIAGCGGINRYFSAVEECTSQTLRFGTSGATMMMGPGGAYERTYLQKLSTVDAFQCTEKELLLFSQNKQILRFCKEVQP